MEENILDGVSLEIGLPNSTKEAARQRKPKKVRVSRHQPIKPTVSLAASVALRDENLAKLGFPNFEEYLQSPAWKNKEAQYRSSGLLQRCLVCSEKEYQLRHLTCARLGEECLGDIIPICEKHNQLLTNFLAENQLPVESSYEALQVITKCDNRKFNRSLFLYHKLLLRYAFGRLNKSYELVGMPFGHNSKKKIVVESKKFWFDIANSKIDGIPVREFILRLNHVPESNP